MKLFSLLLRRAPTESSDTPPVGLNGNIVEPTSAEELEKLDEHEASTSFGNDARIQPSETEQEFENMFCVIDYVDAEGVSTRRRVTLLKLRFTGRKAYIVAVCHERKKIRTFRYDRIKAIITFDGEFFEPVVFFAELLGVQIPDSVMEEYCASPGRAPLDLTSARQLREHLRAPLSVLVCAAMSDEQFHIEELDRIQDYAESEIFSLVKEGRIASVPSLEVIDQLGRMIASMRPQQRSLVGYIEQICGWPTSRIDRLMKALGQVIAADGKIVTEEHVFVDEIIAFVHASAAERLDMTDGERQWAREGNN